MNNDFKSKQIHTDGNDASCVIEFFLPEVAVVTLTILNEHGQHLMQVLEKVKYTPGRHHVQIGNDVWNAHVCFYRLSMQTDHKEIVDTKRLFSRHDER
ncbi:MAG TPA: hypothetical protein VLY03_12705 [Bacteroidota bacterium]|nr:hypothetical protein [Bacteroidota bacterium]